MHCNCTTQSCHAQPIARHSIRASRVRCSPAFASVAVLTLGLWDRQHHHGVLVDRFGASASLSRYHPERGTGRLGNGHRRGAQRRQCRISWLDYRDYRDRFKSLSGLAVHRQCAFTLGDAQPARLAWGELVSGNYFDVMGVEPVLGRVFTREERGDSLGAYPVAVISARLWRSYFQLRSEDRRQDHAHQPACR